MLAAERRVAPFLERLVRVLPVAVHEALDLREITFVLQDWGGPIGTQFTVRHPQRVKRLFLANSVAGYGSAGRKA